MRRSFWFIGGIGAALALALLMAPSGGFPSRPRFQSVGIAASAPSGTGGLDAQRIGVGIGGAPAGAGEIDAGGTITARGDVSILAQSTTNPTIEFDMQDATADNRRWRMGPQAETFICSALNDAGSQIANWCEVQRTAQVIDSVNLKGAEIQINGTSLVQSGSYTGAVTGCTTDPAPVIFWTRIGDATNAVVSLQIPVFNCTSNTTAFTVTGAPAALTPTADTGHIQFRGLDNGVGSSNLYVRMSSAGVLVLRLGSTDAGWTAANAKSLINAVQLTYGLDNS